VTTTQPCGGGGATTKVEVENNTCKTICARMLMRRKNHGKEPCPLSLISFDECIEKSCRKTLMH
jgi:hypothetical protein